MLLGFATQSAESPAL